ncbi:MAG: hypothetical protein HWN68_10755 [Desulfobacterales bacterium]|nr:hypothetical protein [Desulfobacterales bacterium]
MNSKNLHLNEDQVIRSVVDENDLTATVGSHLSTCLVCQGKKQQIEQQLSTLGRMARELAPLPRREVRLPFDKPRSLWSWRPVFVAGFAAVLLIAGICWYALVTTSQEKMMSQIMRETKKDEQLMAEIYALEEYAPVDLYPDISAESDVGYFDEFLRFVSPLEANQNAV